MVIIGIEKIAKKIKLSRKTILRYHREYGFPVKKFNNRWITTDELVLEWFKNNLELYNQSLHHSLLVKEGLKYKNF